MNNFILKLYNLSILCPGKNLVTFIDSQLLNSKFGKFQTQESENLFEHKL